MRAKYETPELDLYRITEEDIVTASWGDNEIPDNWDDVTDPTK